MTEGSSNAKAPAGWYPHPQMANTLCYWDGQSWTDNISPMAPPQPAGSTTSSAPGPGKVLGVVIIAGSVVGTIMALQSASLLTGTGTQWTGAAIAIAAGIASFVLRGSIPTAVRIVAVLAAILALANVIYLENQLDEKRDEINKIFP